MRRYAVIGAGMMGRVITEDLLNTEPDDGVTILDQDPRRAEDAVRYLDSEPVDVRGARVAPLDVLIKRVAPQLALSPEGDILAMRVVVRHQEQ